ncbi:hypothetical protein IRP63_04740 [Clostridium botulinum]|uniref:Uncharacterized protein n=1 Tax=Clostridium botulinum C/D str. DC5 TaxID=1443128 RepID=A0A0A0IGX1_CLOBO|nr:hypothetical protein [Clostridium botulinum]KGM95037.1 hypothetical protein Z956_05990 [Clostridium botulinum D str. CCUG 7971]KGN00208.1 hypothetical protein Z955_04220 [Clostridium botulinum C/D str. DC5]KOC50827.1 hypothetical protein ADU88_01160 [Clostridium botulinum]KOC51701.1 hypothetical protein ADU89_12925 [Clostridium botulinum]KOC54781.1 hypothetical protein ADU90_12200 [Clostridium botulinum]
MLEVSRQTAFDRPTDVYIQNNTDKQFNLFKTDLQSGVLMQNPPDVIKAGQTGYFRGDQTGLVGSSGFITYKTQIGSLTMYISFYWSHPEGATSSIYYGYSSPFGVFYMTPKNKLDSSQKARNQMQKVKDWTTDEYINENILTLNPTGHYQAVTYLVQYTL